MVRGQPNGGFVFWYDLRRGLSDHCGVNAGFGLIRFSLSNIAHAAPAAMVNPFSAYLIGLCIFSVSLSREPPLSIGRSTYESMRLNDSI